MALKIRICTDSIPGQSGNESEPKRCSYSDMNVRTAKREEDIRGRRMYTMCGT